MTLIRLGTLLICTVAFVEMTHSVDANTDTVAQSSETRIENAERWRETGNETRRERVIGGGDEHVRERSEDLREHDN